MKLLLICNLKPEKPGSFERFVEALGKDLSEDCGEVAAVFAEQPSTEVAAKFAAASVRPYEVRGWEDKEGRVRPWAMVLPVLGILKKELPDVAAVHFGNELPTLCLILLCRLLIRKKIRWVWHQRQQIKDPSLGLEGKLSRIKLLSLACDHFVALYKFGRESLLLRAIPDEKISVIYNGVPEYKMQGAVGSGQAIPAPSRSFGRQGAEVREDLGQGVDDFVITNVSSLIPRKRLDVALRAFAKAKRHLLQTSDIRFQLRLLLVGEGAERSALEELTRELGVESDVVFAGQRNDVRDILNASDLMLLTSDAEACPMVVLEAMSVGLPCIATEAGATKELIHSGAAGYVVQRGDYKELAHHIVELATDDALRKTMGIEARSRWKQKFTLSRMIKNHIELYAHLAEKTGDHGL